MNYSQKVLFDDWINKCPIEGVFVDEPVSQVRMDDGTALCPMSDDEGNNAGALCHLGGEQETIPVMRD